MKPELAQSFSVGPYSGLPFQGQLESGVLRLAGERQGGLSTAQGGAGSGHREGQLEDHRSFPQETKL